MAAFGADVVFVLRTLCFWDPAAFVFEVTFRVQGNAKVGRKGSSAASLTRVRVPRRVADAHDICLGPPFGERYLLRHDSE